MNRVHFMKLVKTGPFAWECFACVLSGNNSCFHSDGVEEGPVHVTALRLKLVEIQDDTAARSGWKGEDAGTLSR